METKFYKAKRPREKNKNFNSNYSNSSLLKIMLRITGAVIVIGDMHNLFLYFTYSTVVLVFRNCTSH